MDSLKQNTYLNMMKSNLKLTEKGRIFLNNFDNCKIGFLEQIT